MRPDEKSEEKMHGKFKIKAAATLIPAGEQSPHAGEWEAKITVVNVWTDKAQHVRGSAKYSADPAAALSEALHYGETQIDLLLDEKPCDLQQFLR